MPPTEDDSVGVATPVRIEPSTRTISTSGGTTALSAWKTCCLFEPVASSSRIGGARSFLRSAMMTM